MPPGHGHRRRLLILLPLALLLLSPIAAHSATQDPILAQSANPDPEAGDPCPVLRSDGGGDGSPKGCPITCFRADPVCGANGVTFWCGCPEAACAGVAVAKRGACQVGSGGSGQALLIVHIVWLVVLGIAGLFGFL